jgi:hypothetical protein
MNLENQVVSLKLAKKLKELGFSQDSIFKWRLAGNTGWQIERHFGLMPGKQFSAYTVAELGEMLPMSLTAEQMGNAPEYGEMYLKIWHDSYGWRLTYRNDNEQSILEEPIEAKTEDDARAKMLIHLKENNII